MPRPKREAAITAAQQPSFRAELLSDRVAPIAESVAEKSKKRKAKAEVEPLETKPKVGKPQKKPKRHGVKKATGESKAAPTPIDLDDNDEVLLGHVISRCVGIQHYVGNGARYNKEPLHLRREPNNPYDRNAIAVYTIPGGRNPGGRKVGHVEAKTGDVAVIRKIVDNFRVTLVGQVETGAHQVYKFPLRVSFFGLASDREKIRTQLGHQFVLHVPKSKKARSSRPVHKVSGAGPSDAAVAEPEVEADAMSDTEGDVEVTGETSWAERDTELRKHAIELE